MRFCNNHCLHVNEHGSLLARLDVQHGAHLFAATLVNVKQWRCYARGTLDATEMTYVTGKAYCTRHFDLQRELDACLRKQAIGHGKATAPAVADNQSSELRVSDGAHLLQLDSDPLKCSDIDNAGARRSRLAFEITGCLRTLNVSLRVKLDLLAAARAAAGFERIDLYCALEACDGESDEQSVMIVDALVSGVRAVEPCAAVRCHWWPSAAGILLKNQIASPNRTERLKPEYRADHPQYPYPNHNPETSVDHTLSMCFKLAIVGQLRHRSRMRYDLVWRTRTDFYVSNVSWPLLRTLVARHRAATLPSPSASQTPAPKYLPWFIIPTVHVRYYQMMTDVEAFLSEPAAARYDSWWWKIPLLYASGVVFHPEAMLNALMHAGLARFHDSQMKIYTLRSMRCFPAGRLTKGIHLATPTCRASLYASVWGMKWTAAPTAATTAATTAVPTAAPTAHRAKV